MTTVPGVTGKRGMRVLSENHARHDWKGLSVCDKCLDV